MRKYLLVLLAGLLLLGACKLASKEKTIIDVMDDIDNLDQKYTLQKASFHDEQLLVHMVDAEAIPDLLKELQEAKKKTVAEAASKDKELISILYHIREQMLNSELTVQKAAKLGKRAFVNQTIACTDKELILEGDQMLREAVKYGMNATEELDLVLQRLVERKEDKSLERIGMGKAKPKFYNSDFQSLASQAERNRKAVEKYC